MRTLKMRLACCLACSLSLAVSLSGSAWGATKEVWTIAVDECPSGQPDLCNAADGELALWAAEAWAQATGNALSFRPAGEARARLRIRWAGALSGLYGEARLLVVDGVRGAEVYVRPAPRGVAEQDSLDRDTIVYLTCLHEIGHALGLPHTSAFADIMYNFQYGGDLVEYFARYRRRLRQREDIRKLSGLSVEDIRRVRQLFP